ncbi:MAG: hypothetical protein ACTHPO_12150 [Alphaproteobacteria bacterium]|nr:hypothetical protein [Alphaproteobacteria bacterium]|tara:strand:+ start:1714 stop:2703 length:990 start_codon:yes stop_codon:yes gene_type:complete
MNTNLNDIDIEQIKLIDEDAAEILSNAVHAVKAIMDRRQQMDLDGKNDETLFVLAGEKHDKPAHHLFNMLVINGLVQAQEKPLITHELPHDFLIKELKKKYSEAYEKANKDPAALGALQLVFLAHTRSLLDAPYTREIFYKNLMSLLVDKQIYSAFNDLPHQEYTTSDNPLLAHYLKDVSEQKDNVTLYDKLISRNVPYRNYYMQNVATKLSAEKNARITYQLCGVAHIDGAGVCDSKHGLISLFERSSSAVFPMYLSTDGTELDNCDSLKMSLPCKSAYYSPSTGQPFRLSLQALARKPELNSRVKEESYTDRILTNVGLSNLMLRKD